MKVGPLLVEAHGASKHPDTLHRDEAYYFESLHALCRILNDVPWLLAGGLAVPFILGRFFREHSDIDIMIPVESMSSAYKRFRLAGYRLFRRVIVSHQGRRLVIRYPIASVTDIKSNLNCAMLKVEKRSAPLIMQKIDIHPYKIESGFLVSDYRGPTLKIEASIKSAPVHTGHETSFRCLNLSYVARLKLSRHGVKHLIDLAAIEGGVDCAKAKMRQRSQRCNG